MVVALWNGSWQSNYLRIVSDHGIKRSVMIIIDGSYKRGCRFNTFGWGIHVTRLTRRGLILGGGLLAAGAAMPAVAQAVTAGATKPARRTSFKPGEVWLDTNGKPIQAHAGSIIQVADRYYWYGENKEFTTGKTKVWTWGVRCYESTDLYNWDDLGLIIPPDTRDPTSPLNPEALLDRPHILYNSRTQQFVCWVKVMGKTAQTRTVLVADKITGPYTIVHKDMRPLSMSAGDFDLVVSPDDGKAYMYFERVHSEMICADLTDDYTNVTGYYSTHFPESWATVRAGRTSLLSTQRQALPRHFRNDRLLSESFGDRGGGHLPWAVHGPRRSASQRSVANVLQLADQLHLQAPEEEGPLYRACRSLERTDIGSRVRERRDLGVGAEPVPQGVFVSPPTVDAG